MTISLKGLKGFPLFVFCNFLLFVGAQCIGNWEKRQKSNSELDSKLTTPNKLDQGLIFSDLIWTNVTTLFENKNKLAYCLLSVMSSMSFLYFVLCDKDETMMHFCWRLKRCISLTAKQITFAVTKNNVDNNKSIIIDEIMLFKFQLLIQNKF